MPVVHNDILRAVQHILLPGGNEASNKFYFRAALVAPVLEGAIVDALETWLAFVYHALRGVVSQFASLTDAHIDVIEWEAGRWKTKSNVGVATPDPDWNNPSDLCPEPVAGLMVFTTARPRVKRPFYIAALTEDRVSGSYCGSYVVTRMVVCGVRALDPVDIDTSGFLYPVLVHALTGGTENLTGLTTTNLLTALQRRRPTA